MSLGDAAFSRGDIMRRLAKLEDEQRRMRAARRLESASIGEGGIKVHADGAIRSGDFDGDISKGQAGTDGWALGSERLALGGQLVGPVAFDGGRKHEGEFIIDDATARKVERNVWVPAWANEAIVMLVGMMSGRNDSATPGTVNGDLEIDGKFSQSFNKTVAAGDVFDVTLAQSEVINVSDKISFFLNGALWLNTGDAAWGPNSANNAGLNVNVIFR